MQPIEMHDILCYRFLSEPRYNPAGTRAAFVVSNANEEENSYESRLYLYENGAARPITDLGKERGYVWLDDDRLVFPAVRSAAEKKRAEAKDAFTSYYVLDLRGGEAQPFFTLPFAAHGLKALDEKHFVVVGAFDKAAPELWNADKAAREAYQQEREKDKDYEVFDELPFWFNGHGVVNGQRERLFAVATGPLSITPITAPDEEPGAVTVLGDEVFFSVMPCAAKRPLYGFTLRAWNRKSGVVREVYRSETLALSGMDAVGDRLWLTGTEGKRYGINENDYVYTLDPVTGRLDLLRAEEYDLYNSVGSDVRYGGGRERAAYDGALYHTATRGGNGCLYRLNADGTDTPIVTDEGSIDCFDVANGKALCVALYDMRPQELYEINLVTGVRTRVTDLNGEAIADRYIAKPERLTVQSEGYELEGWVLLPKDYDPAKRYPAVFDIHGGPKTVYGPVFYHEMQMWAGMGYFVFFANPKGSDGRDNAFADIRGGYGATDYRNLMDFMDAVLAAYPAIDPARVCETGGSYGGFMTNWIIGHTDRFCACASQRSISNWLSFWGVSDIGFCFAGDQTAGDLYDDPQKLWAESPLAYAKNVRTPTLFIHSDEDYRCPLDQGLQMYAALVDRGVPARLCLFHGENHELSRSGKPLHRIRRLQEITDWFEKWSQGEK